jgi:hypothetical protein
MLGDAAARNARAPLCRVAACARTGALLIVLPFQPAPQIADDGCRHGNPCATNKKTLPEARPRFLRTASLLSGPPLDLPAWLHDRAGTFDQFKLRARLHAGGKCVR